MSVTAVPLHPLRKGSVAKLLVGLAMLVLLAAGLAWWGTERQVSADPTTFFARNGSEAGVVTTASGLQIKTIQPGRGPRIAINDGVIVDYEGRLLDGTVFDSSGERGPTPMLVRQVVPGFAEALQLMQPGGKYRVWMPPELGYGADAPPGSPIPPNAILDFDVSILQVVPDAALQVPEGGPPGAM